MAQRFVTKDSGERVQYDSGMKRDTAEGKPDFTYLVLPGVPLEDQPITRLCELYERGAKKYDRFNWLKACSHEELQRFQQSNFRHWAQYLAGDRDEDHLAAVLFNTIAIMYLERKLELLEEEDC